jgi:glucosylceramidase
MQLTLITSTFSPQPQTAREQSLAFRPDPGMENQVVNLYPDSTYQTWEGFGGAFTDSAGYVFSLMPEAQQQRLLQAYFDPQQGARYTLGRIHLDSCDFSLEHFEAVSDPEDKDFASFSLDRWGKYVLPLIQGAGKTRGTPLEFMAAPWSPPAFMKTCGQRNRGGALRPEYREAYARYLCRYITALAEAGVRVRRLTLQNEPKAVQAWDSCVYSAEEEQVFIRDFLSPALAAQNLEVDLFIWDHNKERAYERARDILTPAMDDLIRGVAFHWYSGDHFETLRLIQERFPGKQLIQSESCLEYSQTDKNDSWAHARRYAHDLMGGMNNGLSAFYDWNLLLDHQGGPNHVGNFCDAPFLFHRDTGELEARSSYTALTHFSRYILPGAKRIAFSRYTNSLEMTAFLNPQGIVAIFLNPALEPLRVNLRLAGNLTTFSLPPQSLSTCCGHLP